MVGRAKFEDVITVLEHIDKDNAQKKVKVGKENDHESQITHIYKINDIIIDIEALNYDGSKEYI